MVDEDIEIPSALAFAQPGSRFAVQGLPAGSGLAMDVATGLIRGTPTVADRQHPQPVPLLVTTYGENQQASRIFITVSDASALPVPMPFPAQLALVGTPFRLDLGAHFTLEGPPGAQQGAFTIDGLPADTGLRLDPHGGLLEGTPQMADARRGQPLQLLVHVTTTQGHSAAQALHVTTAGRACCAVLCASLCF